MACIREKRRKLVYGDTMVDISCSEADLCQHFD